MVTFIMAVLAALLFPVFSQAKEKGRQTRCLSNLRQISLAVLLYAADHDEMLPLDVTQSVEVPASDPCSPWNPAGRLEAKLSPYIKNTEVFVCPSASTPSVTWDSDHGVCARDGLGYPDFLCIRGDRLRGKHLGYGWNARVFPYGVTQFESECEAPVVPLGSVVSPASKVMVADSRHAFVGVMELAFANYPGTWAFFASNVNEYWTDLPRHPADGPKIVPERDTRHHMGQNAAFFDGHVSWLPYQEFTSRPFGVTAAIRFDK
jgi:prepilin-type processing-associated H-X9-DG protein